MKIFKALGSFIKSLSFFDTAPDKEETDLDEMKKLMYEMESLVAQEGEAINSGNYEKAKECGARIDEISKIIMDKHLY